MMEAIGNLIQRASYYSPEPLASTFRAISRTVRTSEDNSVGGVSLDLNGDFLSLLQQQIEVQLELQSVSMVSNIEKSKHESKMAAIRNIRVA